jgi:hypothetical protein
MLFHLLGLPIETIKIALLFHLSLPDYASLRLQNRLLFAIVDEVLRTIYRIELEAAGLVETHSSDLSIMERLSKLRRRVTAWTRFQIDNRGTGLPESDIVIDHPSLRNGQNQVRLVDIDGGYIVLASKHSGFTNLTKSIYYAQLPSFDAPSEKLNWLLLPYETRENEVIRSFKLAIQKSNLLALVTLFVFPYHAQSELYHLYDSISEKLRTMNSIFITTVKSLSVS